MTDRTPTTAALHEEHTCRDCGAVITLPYARPPKHIGWAAPDPAPLDVERLARALGSVVPEPDDQHEYTVTDDLWYATAIAREYAKEEQP